MAKNIADQLDEALQSGAHDDVPQEVEELVDTAATVRSLASQAAPAAEIALRACHAGQ